MWIIVALLTAICWGVSYMAAGKVLEYTNKNLYLALSSGINLLIFASLSSFGSLTIPGAAWLWIVLAIGASVVGNYLSMFAIELSDPVRAASIEVTYPLWCLIFSLLIIDNTVLTWRTIVASMLIIAGIITLINGK